MVKQRHELVVRGSMLIERLQMRYHPDYIVTIEGKVALDGIVLQGEVV